MPFIAKIRTTGERLSVLDYERMLDMSKDDIVCPFCDEPMYIRGGDRTAYRRHFAHRIECGADWLPEEYASGLETIEHLAGKEWLKLNFRNLLSDEYIKGAVAEYEVIVPIPAVGSYPARKRVADVMVTFPDGRQIALECQLASITPEQLEERTHDYQRAGVDVRWVLGKTADRHQNRSWCEQHFGVSYSFDFTYGSNSGTTTKRFPPSALRSVEPEMAGHH